MALLRKISTLKRVFYDAGLRGIAGVCVRKLVFYDWWCRRDSWILGKWIELRGNAVEIEGCLFSVKNPAISTKYKSRFLFDRYEHPERLAVRQYLDPALPVVEFGGSVGVVACLTNKKLAEPTHHVVVEANPSLVPLLEENRRRNGCRFTVLHCAVAYDRKEVFFYSDPNFLASGTLPAQGVRVKVPSTSLAEVLREHAFKRCTLVCDIEGAEIALVDHEIECLERSVDTFILETHEKLLRDGATGQMLSRLAAAGFVTVFGQKGTYVLKSRPPLPAPAE